LLSYTSDIFTDKTLTKKIGTASYLINCFNQETAGVLSLKQNASFTAQHSLIDSQTNQPFVINYQGSMLFSINLEFQQIVQVESSAIACLSAFRSGVQQFGDFPVSFANGQWTL